MSSTRERANKPLNDLEFVLGLAGGDREFARQILKGFPDITSAWNAVIGQARKHLLAEGPPEIVSIAIRNRRRGWIVLKVGDRFHASVDERPTREPTVISGNALEQICTEAQTVLRPLHHHLKNKKATRNPASQKAVAETRWPGAYHRLKEARLIDQLFVPHIPPLRELTEKLVSAEHPEAGKAATIRKNRARRHRRLLKS